ncbi:MAG: DUF1786 family protein [Desulfococcus multivorans]|jgi:uncharacterized protein (DUF1786 family)|nr:DUF1786 family protein [Desulfococcus multivorans]
MSRYLMIDIGAGTMDVLYYDDVADLHYKAVVKSPARLITETVADTNGNLAITGCEMGGSPLSAVLKERAKTARVVMTHAAAATVHHDPSRVTASGIEISDERKVSTLQRQPDFTSLVLADLDRDRLEGIVAGFGVPFAFDCVAVCAQDHGVAPSGVSHLDYRHRLFTADLEQTPYPHALLYRSDEIPAAMNRLQSIARSAAHLTTTEIYVMDSGMAAILGASMDHCCRNLKTILVLDIATSHTVGAIIDAGQLAAFFEYHTHAVTGDRITTLLRDLADGRLTQDAILAEGGHGAYTRRIVGFAAVEIILATGPKRRLIRSSPLPVVMGAPWGDNMMTGTVGLLEAVRRRKGFSAMTYV